MKKATVLSRSFGIAASAIVIVVTSACSPTAPGTTAPPTSESAPPSPAAGDSAPTIENPKNLEAVNDTCDLLTQQQLDELGMQAQPEHGSSRLGGQVCDWNGHDFSIAITPDTVTGGIGALYKSSDLADNFARSSVKGYPAARIDRQSLLCRVEVGTSDDTKFAVNFTNNNTSDRPDLNKPCEFAEKTAAMVLKNIPDA